jgi:hypothetical protein
VRAWSPLSIKAWDKGNLSTSKEITMSNSQRIEAATRQHVNAVLTNDQIVDLVKVTFPDWKGGVYPSDSAYKRDEAGKLIARGKTAYGDGVLEYLGENSFKVLPTEQIVRRPVAPKKAKVVAAPVVAPTPVPVPTPVAAKPEPVAAKGKPASKAASSIPVATKQKATHVHA